MLYFLHFLFIINKEKEGFSSWALFPSLSLYLREFTSLPDIRKGSRACARDGTGDGVGTRKVECQGGLRARRAYIYIYIYIYIRFALACAFSLQVCRGCVGARYIFKWFLRLGV